MKKGFTIIELIIVISVLIILIGIVIPRMKGAQQAGNIVKAKAELQTLQAAIESYYNTNGTYPACGGGCVIPCQTFFNGATPQMVSSTLYDPFGGTTTTEYKLITNGTYYVFASVGAGGNDLNGYDINATTGVVNKGGHVNSLCITNGTGC